MTPAEYFKRMRDANHYPSMKEQETLVKIAEMAVGFLESYENFGYLVEDGAFIREVSDGMSDERRLHNLIISGLETLTEINAMLAKEGNNVR